MKSFKELTQLYTSSRIPAASLTKDSTSLPPGKSTLDILTTLFERRQNSLSPVFEKDQGQERGIAICIVIVDNLIHGEIWKEWTESQHISSKFGYNYHAKLFIHAKYPEKIQSEWVKQHTLPYTFFPEWNSPEIVRAMLSLLNKATSDTEQPYHRMIFATESCLPCCTLVELGDALFTEEKSWLDAYNIPKSKYEAGYCFEAVNMNIIPRKAIWKSLPGWICLTRNHAMEILALLKRLNGFEKGIIYSTSCGSSSGDITTDLVDAFGTPGQWYEGKGGVHAPEEVFFPTMLALLGYLRPSVSDGVLRKRITYAEWQRHTDANPISYASFNKAIYDKIRASGSLFGRKFSKDAVDKERWRSIVGISAHIATQSTVVSETEHVKINNKVTDSIGFKRKVAEVEDGDEEGQITEDEHKHKKTI